MTRRKVRLAYILNQGERRASYKKRKQGLMKKVQEISTLCGIEACAVLYGPYRNEPEIWPHSTGAVQSVISRFKSLPDMEKFKKMVNQESYTEQRITRLEEQIQKLKRDNREKQISYFIKQCLDGEAVSNFSALDLNEMDWMISSSMKDVNSRLSYLQQHMVPQPNPIDKPVETGSGIKNQDSLEETPGIENQDSMRAPPGFEIQDPNPMVVSPELPITTDSENQDSGVDPETTSDAIANQADSGIDNQVSSVAPEIPMNNDMQNLTWDMDMLSVNEQHNAFDWSDDPFWLDHFNISNVGGAGPSYSNQ